MFPAGSVSRSQCERNSGARRMGFATMFQYCEWNRAPLESGCWPPPGEGKPVVSSLDREVGFTDVGRQLRQAVRSLGL